MHLAIPLPYGLVRLLKLSLRPSSWAYFFAKFIVLGLLGLRSFTSIVKDLSKVDPTIYFNTSLYNTLNINDSIFFTTFLKYYFFIHFLFFFHASLSLSLPIYLSLSLSHLKILKNNQQSHSHLHGHLQPTANSTTHSKATATSIATHSL